MKLHPIIKSYCQIAKGFRLAIFFKRARLRQPLCVLASVVLILGCTPAESEVGVRVTWNEAAKISSTETISIERLQRFTLTKPVGDQKAGIGVILESSIRFLDSTAKIPSLDVRPLMPLLVLRDEESEGLFVVASLNRCTPWLRNGEPNPPYWAFRLKEGQWYRTDLPEHLLGKKANILVDLRAEDRAAIPDAEVSARKDSQSGSATAQRVLQRVLASDSTFRNCGHATKTDVELDFNRFKRL